MEDFGKSPHTRAAAETVYNKSVNAKTKISDGNRGDTHSRESATTYKLASDMQGSSGFSQHSQELLVQQPRIGGVVPKKQIEHLAVKWEE